MTIVGDASAWGDAFPDELLPDILEMVCAVWSGLKKPQPSDHERATSQRMVASIRRSLMCRRLPLRVDIETTLIDDTGEIEIGRLDLRFTSASYHPEAYFSFECKRLCVHDGSRFRALAKEYVTDGMMRYVSGKYAPSRRHGGMIGYVHLGTRETAVAKVGAKIKANAVLLRMTAPAAFEPCSLAPGNAAIRTSIHERNTGSFSIHHVFLPCA